MSGEPPERPTVNGFVTPEDATKELNFIEWLRSEISGEDEYLEAILENQRLMAMQMLQNMQGTEGLGLPPEAQNENGPPEGYNVDVPPVPSSEYTNRGQLPLGAVGVANRKINGNDTGPATFQVNGTVFSATIRYDSKDGEAVSSGGPVKVAAPGNICQPIQDVSLSALGFSGSIGVDSYERAETDADVTIYPGNEKTVLKETVRGASWVSVGTNDETHSLYQYYIDDEPLFDEPLKESLGLYNDPFIFPEQLSASRKIAVEVRRQSSANGPEDYYSKIDYFE